VHGGSSDECTTGAAEGAWCRRACGELRAPPGNSVCELIHRVDLLGVRSIAAHLTHWLTWLGPNALGWRKKFWGGAHLALGAGDVNNAQLAKGVRQPQVLVASTHPTPRTGSEERWIGFPRAAGAKDTPWIT
jgi:hypothetical protein